MTNIFRQGTHHNCFHEFITEMHESNPTHNFWLTLVKFHKYESRQLYIYIYIYRARARARKYTHTHTHKTGTYFYVPEYTQEHKEHTLN